MSTDHEYRTIVNPPPRRRRLAVALTAGGVCVALAACGGGDGSSAPTSPPTLPATTLPATTAAAPSTTAAATTAAPTTAAPTTAAPTTAAPTTPPPTTVPAIPRQPLTGELLGDWSEVTNRPALVVKIDNAPAARRNHTGLALADIVFEEIVEGSITRFAAVFHTQDADPVGPIRSGRSQDVDLLTALRNPLFAWSGGNPGVTRLIAGSSFVDLNWQHTPNTYYRGPGSTPHNLYSSTQRLWSHIPYGHPGAPPQQFQYLPDGAAFAGDPIAGVDVRMRGIDVAWDWAPSIGQFVRSQEGAPHNDKTYGRIHARNVVMMVVEYQPSQIDTRSPEAQTIGNGPVYVISDGRAIEGRWWREANDQPIHLLDTAGQPLLLNPGITWVELVEAIPSGDPSHPGAAITFRYAT